MTPSFLNRISVHFAANLPFVIYSLPADGSVRAILQDSDEIVFERDYSGSGFVFAPFAKGETAILIRPDVLFSDSVDSVKVKGSPKRMIPDKDPLQKHYHKNLINNALKQIKTNTFKKVVLTRYIDVPGSYDPIRLFRFLLGQGPKALCYLWHHPQIGTWAGATPENLLNFGQGRFETMALAATHASGPQSTWTPKEIEEQRIVTEYITRVLGGVSEDMTITGPETVEAGPVSHLRTRISGRAKEADLSKIIDELHPTPAVAGVPLEPSVAFIKQNEGYDREFYTGFLGELNMPEGIGTELMRVTRLFVNLRCMQLLPQKARIYIGGGITEASDPDSEWEETVAKSRAMRDIIGCMEDDLR